MRIVTKAFLRYLTRRKSLTLLQLLGIAVGVAAVVGMTFSAYSALASFRAAIEFLNGQATHSLARPAGLLEESILGKLMQDPSVRNFSPVIDRRLRLANGQLVRVLGIDPLLDRVIRPELARTPFAGPTAESRAPDLSFILGQRTVLLEAGLAAELGTGTGKEIITSQGTFRVLGTFPNPSGEPLLLMDIALAQRIFHLAGKLDHVDLILSDPDGFRQRWQQGFRIQSGFERQQTFQAMLDAFRVNLEAMSLIALFVALFLIYNTTMFTVVSRRRDAGILLSLGATRGEILRAFLMEIILLGSLGGVGGGMLGYLLSRFLTAIIGGTISNLYFFLRPQPPDWSWWIPLAGGVIGCGASLLGSIFPMAALVQTNPVETLRGRTANRRSASLALRIAAGGVAFLLLGAALLLVWPQQIYAAFAAIFVILVGLSMLTGLIIVVTTPAMKWLLTCWGGLPGKIAALSIRQNLDRSGVAVAAFMVALAMSIGLASMIGSFRQSVIWWMEAQLRGDIYISAPAGTEVPQNFTGQIEALPGVAAVDTYRKVQMLFRGKTAFIAAVNSPVLQRYAHFQWLAGGNENWDAVRQGAVIVSESFVRNFAVHPGDLINIDGVNGSLPLRVAGAFYDYSTEHGLIMMDKRTYAKLFNDPLIDSLGIFLAPAPAAGQTELLASIQERAAPLGLPVFTRQQFYSNILAVFDSTFAVTRSMRIMAIIIAFFGIAGALLTLFIERWRDFGILRALGFSTTQVVALTVLEAIGMGLYSLILSAGTGTLLAWFLIKVINLRSFHWTVFFFPQWEPYAAAALTTLAASLGAAVYPAWKVIRNYPQMQLREE